MHRPCRARDHRHHETITTMLDGGCHAAASASVSSLGCAPLSRRWHRRTPAARTVAVSPCSGWSARTSACASAYIRLPPRRRLRGSFLSARQQGQWNPISRSAGCTPRHVLQRMTPGHPQRPFQFQPLRPYWKMISRPGTPSGRPGSATLTGGGASIPGAVIVMQLEGAHAL